jgi:CRISPR-associated protein Cas2
MFRWFPLDYHLSSSTGVDSSHHDAMPNCPRSRHRHTDAERLNGYRIMWLFAMFDLPTGTKKERDAAARFRKDLLRSGFTRLQFSVYVRQCPSLESAETYIRRIERILPPYGHVSILRVTDKQFGKMINYYRAKPTTGLSEPVQLTFF